MIKAGSITILTEIHTLNKSIWNKEELPEDWKKSIIVPVYKKCDRKIVVIIEHVTFSNYVHNLTQHPAVKFNFICRGNYWGSSVWISTQQVN